MMQQLKEQKMMKCPNCGGVLDDSDWICNCGWTETNSLTCDTCAADVELCECENEKTVKKYRIYFKQTQLMSAVVEAESKGEAEKALETDVDKYGNAVEYEKVGELGTTLEYGMTEEVDDD